tara:strand:- start:266 stop:433 length:168 start_codon:yes stop_codon:yes gene_type:complete
MREAVQAQYCRQFQLLDERRRLWPSPLEKGAGGVEIDIGERAFARAKLPAAQVRM